VTQLLVQSSPQPTPGAVGDPDLPYLADGVELIGRYEGSGFRSAPYLVKRGDGQVIQVSELIYLVAEAVNVTGDVEEAAARVSVAYGREVSADNVLYLIEKKLRPIGLLWSPGAPAPPAPRANPLLALRLRLPLVPERAHRFVTTALKPLFWPPVVAIAIALVVALDIYLVVGLGTNVISVAQTLIYAPQLLLPLTALTVAMGLFHEIGHATAARYGGAKPGAMGAGIYIVWPVFYTDVTDSYRLDRRGRLRTDLGGVYFNALFMVAMGAVYMATGHHLFLVFIMLAHIETGRQFLPFIRLDGYYILSDLAGVPNLFSYMGPALTRAALFWRRGDRASSTRARRLDALTRRTQVVLIVWACVTGPILAFHLVVLVIFLPEIAGAAWGSAGVQLGIMSEALAAAQLATAANAALGIFFLALPTLGIGYIAVRRLTRVPRLVERGWARRPVPTAAVVFAVTLAVVLHVGLVWPDKFSEAASAPGRARAEAEARASAAEARARVARGAEAVSDAVSRMTPGLLSSDPPPVWPAPPAPEPGEGPPAPDGGATANAAAGDGGSGDGAGAGVTGRTAGGGSSPAPGGAPAGQAPPRTPAGPAPTVPGAPVSPPTTVPSPPPAPTTTTTPPLKAVEDLLSPILDPK
jgi:putative peptide zinc metalloprotease protein